MIGSIVSINRHRGIWVVRSRDNTMPSRMFDCMRLNVEPPQQHSACEGDLNLIATPFFDIGEVISYPPAADLESPVGKATVIYVDDDTVTVSFGMLLPFRGGGRHLQNCRADVPIWQAVEYNFQRFI
jgi:hypothetical protein